MCETDNRQDAAAQHREARLALRDDLEGWGGETVQRKGIYVSNYDSFTLPYGRDHNSVAQQLSSKKKKKEQPGFSGC